MTMLNDDFDDDGRVKMRRNIMSDGSLSSDRSFSYSGARSIDPNAPDFEGQDVAALAMIAIMMLGPLAASAAGWGG